MEAFKVHFQNQLCPLTTLEKGKPNNLVGVQLTNGLITIANFYNLFDSSRDEADYDAAVKEHEALTGEYGLKELYLLDARDFGNGLAKRQSRYC